LLALVTSRLALLDPDIVAVYLYGSVATGRAAPPASDLDLLVVLNRGEAEAKIQSFANEISAHHLDLVREVAIATVVLGEIWSNTTDGLGIRCFIKHYCLPLHGPDLRPEIPPCAASPEVAWAFNCNIGDSVESAKSQLAAAKSPAEVERVCRASARRVTLATTSLVSIVGRTWTTSRDVAAEAMSSLYPQWARATRKALGWCDSPSQNHNEVQGFLDGFASWPAEELEGQARTAIQSSQRTFRPW
jgi:predicted nucleotidyltransferase